VTTWSALTFRFVAFLRLPIPATLHARTLAAIKLSMSEITIDISKPQKEFNNFLKLIGNSRIIFSGAFGVGKTYFLKRHFDNHADYLALHLYPTNYSVSTNSDIFELIKYDILYELLRNKPQLEKLELSFLNKLAFLDIRDTTKLLTPFIELIPKIGKSISVVIDGIVKLSEAMHEKTKELKLDEGQLLKEFAERIEGTAGNIYEHDFYTQLIIKLVNQLREDKKKAILLIIDDLDRIDPEHVFRLLNVFAAHLDLEKQEENKFGLDKVIVCCDIENIRTIFSSKYGIGVDFNGYIDKFYSREIFDFDNTAIVVQSITGVLSSMKIDDKLKDLNYISLSNNYYFKILLTLIASFVGSNTINLRTLIRLVEVDYSIPMYHMVLGAKRIKNWQVVIVIAIDFLVKLYGSKTNLVSAINKTSFIIESNRELDIDRGHITRLIGDLVLFADHVQHSFNVESSYKISFQQYMIHYKVHASRVGFDEVYFAKIIDIVFQPTNTQVESINYKDLLLKVIDMYYEKRGVKFGSR
jgi:hypothetical protein